MGVTTDRKPLTRTPYHSPRKKQYHIFKKLDADYLAKELETALDKVQERREAARTEQTEKENAATDGDVKYSMQILPDGTEYVKLDKNVGKTDREVFNSLVGKPIFTNDGDVILIVKRLSRIDMFHELMRRLPKWNRGMSLDELKRINHEVNQNIDDAINASRFAGNKDDVDDRHAESGIASFDTRSVVVADNQNAYDFDIAIAVLGDGRKIGYAKKYLGTNAEMWKKIKEAEDGRTISPNAQLPAEAGNASTDSVQQSSEKSNSKFSMKLDTDYLAKELETALEKAQEAVKNAPEAKENAATEGGGKYSRKIDVLALENVDWMDNHSSIKQQLQKHADEINEMEPVAVVDFASVTYEEAKELIADQIPAIGGKRIVRGGISFAFDKTGIDAIVRHASGAEEYAAALSSPYVAKHGKLISGHRNHKGKGNATLTYAAPVIINGTPVNVGVAIMFTDDGRAHAANVGLQTGGSLRIANTKAPEGNRSRVYRYGKGTALPTSDAFNSSIPASSEKSNSKFSMKLPVEETGTLIALHNLSEDKLQKALQLGGFPMPSIAVTKANIPHTNFGDITLVMDKSTVDPQADRRNTVYSADAWTPTFPETEYEANEKVRSRISKLYYALSGRIGYDATRPLYNYVNDIEREIARAGGESGIIEKERNNTDMMKVFLADRGKAIPEAITEEQIKRLDDATVSMYDYFIKALGEDAFRELTVKEGQNPLEVRKAWWSEHGDAFESVYREYMKTLGFSDEEATNVLENESLASQTRKAIQMRNYLNKGAETRTTVENAEATKEAIRRAVDSTEYDEWLHGLFDGIVKSTGIYNGSEIYTPSGNRRSFAQTHYPVTLENIAKAMAAQNGGNTKNVSGFYGINTLRAATAKRFASIADMHENEGRLQQLTEEQEKAIKDNLSERLMDIMERILESREKSRYDNQLILMDQIGNILTEIADRPKVSIDSVMKAFEKTGYKVGTPIATEIRDFLFDVSQMPVYIFEAKPERAVRFNEVLAAVTPSGTDSELLDALREAGVQNILEYQKDDTQDRLAKVNSVEGAKFSRKLGQNETMEGGTDGSNEGGLLREVSGVLSQNERGDNSTVLGRGAKIAERKQFKRPGDFTEADLRKLTTDFSRLIDGHLSEEGRVLLKAFEQDSHGVDRFAQDVYSSCTNSLAEAELRWMDYIPNIHEVYDAFADAFPGKENEDVKKSRKLLPPTDEAERLDIEVQSKLATLQSELEKAKKRADYWQGQTKRTKEPSVRMEDVRALTRRMLSDFMSTATVGKIAPQVKALADFIVSGHDGTEELTWLGAKARALEIAEQIIGSAWAPNGTDVYGSYIFDAESVYGVSADELRKHISGYELYITRGEMEDIADYQIWRKHLQHRRPAGGSAQYGILCRRMDADLPGNGIRGKRGGRKPHIKAVLRFVRTYRL